MEVRLVQLLGSFITTTSTYALARLEYAMRHPESASPPLIDRLSDASEATLRSEWERIERQLESARRYVKEHEANARSMTARLRGCSGRRANSSSTRGPSAG